MFLSNEGPTREMLDFTIRIGRTPTFSYFDLYLYSAYAAPYVYFTFYISICNSPSQTAIFDVFLSIEFYPMIYLMLFRASNGMADPWNSWYLHACI